MNSLYKYISLLAIAILAISTFGSASAEPVVKTIVDKETNYSFEVGQTKFDNCAFIDDSTIDSISEVLSANGLLLSDYLVIKDVSGIKYLDSVIKGGIAFKADKIISAIPNNETGNIDKHVERISLIVWN